MSTKPITAQRLKEVQAGFHTLYQSAYEGATSDHTMVATTVPSDGASEIHGWLGQLPGVREWVGDRVINRMSLHGFEIYNKDWELTEAVARNSIQDDKVGIYALRFTNMGQSARAHPPAMVWPLLAQGFANKCYDGKNFFSAAHPGFNAKGNKTAVSNMQDGSGAGWYLLDLSADARKPLVYQQRQGFEMVSLMGAADDNVFMRKEYVFGVDGRDNAGYGLWQFAYGSKAALTAENYALAKAAMEGQYKRDGEVLGARVTHLVYHSSLEADAKTLLKAVTVNGGDSNIWYEDSEAYKGILLPAAS